MDPTLTPHTQWEQQLAMNKQQQNHRHRTDSSRDNISAILPCLTT